MKSSQLLPLMALLLSALTANLALAQISRATPTNFCDHPVEFICKPYSRENLLDREIQLIKKRVPDLSEDFEDNAHKIYSYLRVRYGWDFDQKLERVFLEVRSALIQRIKTNKIFSPDKKQTLIQRLEKVSLVKWKSLSSFLNPEFTFAAVQQICGNLLLKDNATMIISPTGESNFVICPGAAAATYAGGSIDLRGLAATIGHELAHFIDNSRVPDLNKEAAQCFIENHFKNHDSAANFTDESIADYWGYTALADILKTVPPSLRQATLVTGLNDLCNVPANAGHPAGNWRIEFLGRGNPQLAKLMGCAPPLPTAQITCNPELEPSTKLHIL